MMAAKIVDVEDLDIKNRTDKAILVDDGKVSVWLPLSQVEVEENRDGTYTVTLPEWLAKDKGLI
jgi:hypothetical protein